MDPPFVGSVRVVRTVTPAAAPTVEPVSTACPRPVRRPVMRQGWRDLCSIHWRYPAATVQALLPPGFTVDTFEGDALVGLLPFRMERVRFGPLGPFGRWSTFPETNVRTYLVDGRGRRGVWFCSLDIDRLVPTLVARASYNLPYCWGRMSIERRGDVVEYLQRRRWPRGATAASRVAVRVGAPRPPGPDDDLVAFVTARWALGTTFAGRPVWAEVDHEPWPVHDAELLVCDESLVTAAGLPAPTGEPLVLWSPGVEVAIGRPRLVPR